MDYNIIISQIEINLNEFERNITQSIIDIMNTNNYVKFYKFQNDWVFEDDSGIKHPSDIDIQQPLDYYYETIDRPGLYIEL
jgi:hypothetical protein